MRNRLKAREVMSLFAPSPVPVEHRRVRQRVLSAVDELSWRVPLEFGPTMASYLVSRSKTGAGPGLLD